MKRIYHPYQSWEEVPYGMYRMDIESLERDDLVNEAIYLLSNPDKLKLYMQFTIAEWPNSTEHNMTNPSRNKQAWLGQAACCLFAKVPEECTKQAWSMLTDEQREAANAVADDVIENWRKSYA